jgi:hypothetical protein
LKEDTFQKEEINQVIDGAKAEVQSEEKNAAVIKEIVLQPKKLEVDGENWTS